MAKKAVKDLKVRILLNDVESGQRVVSPLIMRAIEEAVADRLDALKIIAWISVHVEELK